MSDFQEILLRVLTNYVMQGVWSVILALILLKFYLVYREGYLKYWSLSWAAFSVYMILAAVAIMNVHLYAPNHPLRISFSVLSLIGGYLQLIWLILGTLQLLYGTSIKRKHHLLLIGLAIVIGFSTSIAYIDDPEAFSQRLFLRVGLRSLVTGIGFLCMGGLIFYKKFSTKSLGRLLLIIAFITYGIEQLQYFVTGFLTTIGQQSYFIGYGIIMGMLDFLLQTIMGIGMIVWLLEIERKKLLKTNRELDSFLYSTSHDLRAPIASLLGLSNIAKADTKDPNMHKYLKMIDNRVNKLDEVISDILNYSRVSKRELSHDFVDFNELIDQSIADVKFNEKANKIRLIYDRNNENVLYTDEGQLKIIMNNLISNAVKYHDLQKPDPWIKIDFQKNSNLFQITVEDNGCGISSENQERIFDMFYRASNTSDGSGLGLFISKEAANRLGGSLSVESMRNKGSKFILTLSSSSSKN